MSQVKVKVRLSSTITQKLNKIEQMLNAIDRVPFKVSKICNYHDLLETIKRIEERIIPRYKERCRNSDSDEDSDDEVEEEDPDPRDRCKNCKYGHMDYMEDDIYMCLDCFTMVEN